MRATGMKRSNRAGWSGPLLAAAFLLISLGAWAASGGEKSLLGMTRLSGIWEKPVAPIEILVEPAEMIAAGRQRVRIVVTPLAEGASLQVRAAGQEGISVRSATIAGGAGFATSTREGLTVAREAATLVAGGAARVPRGLDLVLDSASAFSGRLLVEATLTLADGRRQTAIALWGKEAPAAPATDLHPGSRVVTTPDGRQILEIPSGKP
jgi:hypothetical protein